jgi:uncharacterized protein YvpB
MSQAKGRVRPHIVISLVTALATLALVFLGAVAYWRLERLAWASHRQTQVVLDSLVQRAEEIDRELAVALQELKALKREQEAVQSRLQALEPRRLEISDLRSDISDLDRRLDDLSAISEDLVALGEGLQRADHGGDSQVVPTPSPDGPPIGPGASESADSSMGPTSLEVPLHKQTHTLSCEATSASMVAAFFGVPLSEEEAIASLPRDENPNLGFRGDIDGPPGGLDDYGVHAGPIRQLLTEHDLRVTDIQGGLEGIRSALEAGHPVIAWITYHLWEERPVELELASGATVRVVPYEHTVVLEGYTADGLWALDPYDGERQFMPWAGFERSWGYLDEMALEIVSP